MRLRDISSAILPAALAMSLAAAPALAQPQEGDAKSILKAMSDYVGGQRTIELTFDSDIEVITPQLEKSLRKSLLGPLPLR